MRISDWSSDVCSSDLVAGLRHGVEVGAAGVELGVHVGHLALDELELTDALAKLLAVVDVGHHHIEACLHDRSEERRVGKECVSTCRSRWSTYHEKKNNRTTTVPTLTEKIKIKN